MMRKRTRSMKGLAACVCAICLLVSAESGTPRQKEGNKNGGTNAGARARKNEQRGSVRSVTIPVTLNRRGGNAPREELQLLELVVQEDGEAQEILSARGADRAPLAFAVLIQDDVQSPVSNEIKGLATFIRALPAGSRVLVGYLRA